MSLDVVRPSQHVIKMWCHCATMTELGAAMMNQLSRIWSLIQLKPRSCLFDPIISIHMVSSAWGRTNTEVMSSHAPPYTASTARRTESA
eukprot:6655237-Prymnesium_polylepis.1